MTDYSDCHDILDKALASAKGLRVTFATEAEAIRFRLKCNQARVDMRKASRDICEPGDPGYGKTQYDQLVLRLRGTDVLIEYEKPTEILEIKEI